ncbi:MULTISPECIES: uroporphyrinogen decarboxylase family protein [Clostridium]|nr:MULTISPECIES: uroporphyrinogen decarboxylase family protein [Clostridium]ADK15333.1 putative uroporphyrinogen decarboxylase/methylcobalamin:coenzyme M methyltransferase [Clostridium ljungdahlii DSM 13528]OAA88433.1 Uroporphyrinogen decarboxylase [Clostridium ljungdahlii DSM 13528]
MKSNKELYNEHLERIKKNIAMQKTDRTPIMLHAGAFLLRYAGGKLCEFVTDNEAAEDKVVNSLKSIGDIDCVITPVRLPTTSGLAYLSASRVPGRELKDDAQWQIDEIGKMTEEDYDVIIDKGWNYFFKDFCEKNLKSSCDDMKYYGTIADKIAKKYTDAGCVILTTAVAGGPFTVFSGARTIPKLMRDMHRMPEKVEAAFDAFMVDKLNDLRKQIREKKPLAVFVGGGRGAGDFLSMKDFDRYMWKYMKQNIDVILEEGSNIYFHLDLDWSRFLDYFLDVPKGRAIFHPDSSTDIFKAKELLGGRMAFMGDVAPSLLSLGTPDEVYDYSKKLVDEFSSQGFFMAAGCCVPPNSKPENVKAMIAAAMGK